jgi:hypothetical protein
MEIRKSFWLKVAGFRLRVHRKVIIEHGLDGFNEAKRGFEQILIASL